MKTRLLLAALICTSVPWFLNAADPGAIPLPASGSRSIATPTVPASAPSSDLALEQGKTLYDQGQYVAALDKFMKVLRRDPQHVEARHYLTLVVDKIRTQRKNAPKQQPIVKGALPTAAIPAPVVDEEVRKRVRQRQLLTLDLAAIPGVKIIPESKQVSVEIPTGLLFAEKTGGLREEGIPILDRVAAWLKTFGQQPIVIHCYPEELDEANLTGSLFLHRYAQLYGFFVDEHKLPAVRFVSVEPGKNKKSGKDKDKSASDGNGNLPADNAAVLISTAAAKVVIVSMGGGALTADESVTPSAKWLEFSILPSSSLFNPQEGDWVNLDICALTRKGLRSWYFRIAPEKNKTASVLSMEGKGNLLKRVSWDGRDQSGSFVAPGNYVCRLTATDADGSTLNQEISVKVHTGERTPMVMKTKPLPPPPVLTLKPKARPPVPKPPKAVKAATYSSPSNSIVSALPKASPEDAAPPVRSIPVPAPQPAYNSEAEDLPDVEAPKPAKSVSPMSDLSDETPETAAPEESHETDAGVHAIWKQVIQFDVNDEDLKPTLKASLERIAKTLEVYPLQKVRIMGFADRTETNASGLAKKRADSVRSILVNEYQVDSSRVLIAGGRVGSGTDGRSMSKVEISITN